MVKTNLRIAITPALIAFVSVLLNMSLSAQSSSQRNYGGDGMQIAHAVAHVPGGGYILGGEVQALRETRRDILLMRTDASGDLQWSQVIGGESDEKLTDILVADDGGYIFSGEKYRMQAQEGEVLIVIRTSPLGEVAWRTVFNEGDSESEGYALRRSQDGNYLIAGIWKGMQELSGGLFNIKNEKQHLYVIKFDPKGNKIWSRIYDTGAAEDRATAGLSLTENSKGELLVVGHALKSGQMKRSPGKPASKLDDVSSRSMLVVKLSADGNLIWSKEYRATNITMGYAVEAINNGYIIGGAMNVASENNSDVFLMEIAENGSIQWCNQIGGKGFESVSDIAIDDDCNILLSGLTRSNEGNANDAMLLQCDADGNLIRSEYMGGQYSDAANDVLIHDGTVVLAGETGTPTKGQDAFLNISSLKGTGACLEELPVTSKPLSFRQFNLIKAKVAPIEDETSAYYGRITVDDVVGGSQEFDAYDPCN